MRTFSTELIAKLQAEELVCFCLIDMNIDGTWYRYTDCDVPLVVDEHTYTPMPIQPGVVQHGTDVITSSFEFKVSAQASGLLSAFVNGTPQGGQFVARLVFLNANYYAAYHVNRLTDGGFETGAMGSWALVTGSGITASASVTSSSPYKGTYCCHVSITDGWGTGQHVRDLRLRQNISQAISVGTLYDFSFAAKAAAARKIACDIGTATGSDYPMFNNIDLTTSWEFFHVPYVAGAAIGGGSAYVNFYLARSDSNDDVYIDQVRFSDSLYPITLYKGYIGRWELDEDWINITVVSALSGWTRRVVRKQVHSCRWIKFKGEECGYSGGETWCDRTYARCNTLGNTANFGGFRWITEVAGKAIYWGRNPPWWSPPPGYGANTPPRSFDMNWEVDW